MLRGGDLKEIYEMKGEGHSARAIARDLGLARNTVLKYLNSPEAMRLKPRRPRGSKLDPYTGHIDRRMGGLENCRVLLREIRTLGYDGCYATLTNYVQRRRRLCWFLGRIQREVWWPSVPAARALLSKEGIGNDSVPSEAGWLSG